MSKQTLPQQIRVAIQDGKILPIFCRTDLVTANIADENHNLSNYDRKNSGANNTNYLYSRKIGDVIYYAFNEKVFNDEIDDKT